MSLSTKWSRILLTNNTPSTKDLHRIFPSVSTDKTNYMSDLNWDEEAQQLESKIKCLMSNEKSDKLSVKRI